MSFLVNKLAEHAGDVVADKIKSALGGGGDDKKDKKKKNQKNDKDDKDGGFLSIFKKDKEEEPKGGLFSFGKDNHRDKDKNHDEGNFFQKIFKKDDDDDNREKITKKRGFAGLFSEQDQPGAAMCEEGAATFEEGAEGSGPCDHITDRDIDLMSDLLEVAEKSS